MIPKLTARQFDGYILTMQMIGGIRLMGEIADASMTACRTILEQQAVADRQAYEAAKNQAEFDALMSENTSFRFR